jgi:hypothetical protein
MAITLPRLERLVGNSISRLPFENMTEVCDLFEHIREDIFMIQSDNEIYMFKEWLDCDDFDDRYASYQIDFHNIVDFLNGKISKAKLLDYAIGGYYMYDWNFIKREYHNYHHTLIPDQIKEYTGNLEKSYWPEPISEKFLTLIKKNRKKVINDLLG